MAVIWRFLDSFAFDNRVFGFYVDSSMILSGVLAGYVFTSSKFFEPGSPPGFLNRLMGNAPGRQYAMVYILSALGIDCLSLVALFNRNIRQVETVEPEVLH
jgi:hypothetical protein